MKSERRHQLKSSELGDMLEQAKVYAAENWSKIASVAVLVIVLIAVGLYIRHSRSQEVAQNWQQMFAVLNRDTSAGKIDLEQIALQSSDKNLAAIAWKVLGDQYLNRWLLAEDIQRDDLAREARKAYMQILDQYQDNTLAVADAHIGLAVLAENLGQWSDARDHCQKIVSDPRFVGTIFAALAQNRLANLNRWQEPVVFAAEAQTVQIIQTVKDQ